MQNHSILLQQEPSNSQQAIKLSTNLLEKAKIINENYYLNILESTAKYGPYYVIMDGFAMPHASGTSDSVFG
ncbi:PTS sugar transporter subunit IIA, partial [Mycoplasmopsis synoviae]